jgi:transposase InsO family protein
MRQKLNSLALRAPWNRLNDETRHQIIALKQENPNYNCQWISELASDQLGHSISRTSVWRILKEAHLLVDSSIVRINRKRFEADECGDLVQMDTSWGYWLSSRRLCLIVLLDDHSRYILAARFFSEDSAYNNMLMIREAVTRWGSFKVLYTDNASFFKAIRHNKSFYQVHHQEEYESQITRACREVGITHITHKPYQPQGKGKIERLFRFTTGSTPKKRFDPVGFRPLYGEVNLEDVFCFKDTRKVDSCNQFSYEGRTYTIPKQHCMVAFRITLHIHPNRHLRIWHQGNFICELPFIN